MGHVVKTGKNKFVTLSFFFFFYFFPYSICVQNVFDQFLNHETVRYKRDTPYFMPRKFATRVLKLVEAKE